MTLQEAQEKFPVGQGFKFLNGEIGVTAGNYREEDSMIICYAIFKDEEARLLSLTDPKTKRIPDTELPDELLKEKAKLLYDEGDEVESLYNQCLSKVCKVTIHNESIWARRGHEFTLVYDFDNPGRGWAKNLTKEEQGYEFDYQRGVILKFPEEQKEFTIDDLEPGKHLVKLTNDRIYMTFNDGHKNFISDLDSCDATKCITESEIIELRLIDSMQRIENIWSMSKTIWKRDNQQKTLEQRVAELERKLKP